MKYIILFILFIFTSCSLEKRLSIKQRKVNKLDFEISEIKKQLSLPLDSTIVKTDTLIFVKESVKRDTLKLECDEEGNVILHDTILKDGQIITENQFVETEKVIQNDVLKTKKEIVYVEKKLNNKQLALIAIGFVTVLIGLMYVIGYSAGFLIRLLINKKHLV